MCTLVIVWTVFEDAPVVVAANRDESVDRPSTPPRRREGGTDDGGEGGTEDGGEGGNYDGGERDPAVVAPRDERAGGTWIGYNEAGVFAGLSNRWTDRELAGDRSRGHLVDDALAHGDAEAAVRAVEDAVIADEYDGFNLVVADAATAVLLEWDGRRSVTDLDPGVHVVMNAGYDDTFRAVPDRPEAARHQAERAVQVRAALQPDPGEAVDAWLDRAAAVLGDHDFGVCVHGEGFGTCSSSLIALRSDGTATYRFADGPPCETSYRTIGVGSDGDDGLDRDGTAEGQS